LTGTERVSSLNGERDSVDISLNYTTVRQRLCSAATTAQTRQEINETLPERIIIEGTLDEGALGPLRPVGQHTAPVLGERGAGLGRCDNLQRKQAECLGVVRKSPISVMTRISDPRTT
jgi:hypothetical protein